jgi:predicted transcriptional regulator
MDDAPLPDDTMQADRRESATEKRRRLAREAEMIAEARAELQAGLFVDGDEVEAWLDSIGTGHELPMPPVRRR